MPGSSAYLREVQPVWLVCVLTIDTHELLGLSRAKEPLPDWFPEVSGHIQQNGTSRYMVVTAGTTPRFDGIKSFGTSWAPRWVEEQKSTQRLS